jgi:hypothetical protein
MPSMHAMFTGSRRFFRSSINEDKFPLSGRRSAGRSEAQWGSIAAHFRPAERRALKRAIFVNKPCIVVMYRGGVLGFAPHVGALHEVLTQD